MKLAAVVVLGWAAGAAAFDRFFVMGDGRVSLVNAHTHARADVRYRRRDGTYDESAIAEIRRAFRSEGDAGEGKGSLRLIELLSHVQELTNLRPLTLMSGYRSPDYNEALRGKGVRAAGGSLHTEGLAADVAFPSKTLKPLWMKVRAMDCCGAGYYAKEGFLHLDVGRPRFWEPQTSRVEENLSAGNARLFARTEYDRYAAGEPIVVTFHGLTVPPVLIAGEANVLADGGKPVPVALQRDHLPGADCTELPRTGATVRIAAPHERGRGRLVFATCEPRIERTPASVDANELEIR